MYSLYVNECNKTDNLCIFYENEKKKIKEKQKQKQNKQTNKQTNLNDYNIIY
jgi:hypothetical protein